MAMKKAILLSIAILAGCERVAEYKCNTEQIEKANEQFEWCKQGVTMNLESRRVDQCWKEATAAHCEILREFNRAEIK